MKEIFEVARSFCCLQPHRFTVATTAQHHSPHDFRIVFDGTLCGVGDFVTQHPEGLVLLDGAGGQDMATVFARPHDPPTVALFSNFCRGPVAEARQYECLCMLCRPFLSSYLFSVLLWMLAGCRRSPYDRGLTSEHTRWSK